MTSTYRGRGRPRNYLQVSRGQGRGRGRGGFRENIRESNGDNLASSSRSF